MSESWEGATVEICRLRREVRIYRGLSLFLFVVVVLLLTAQAIAQEGVFKVRELQTDREALALCINHASAVALACEGNAKLAPPTAWRYVWIQAPVELQDNAELGLADSVWLKKRAAAAHVLVNMVISRSPHPVRSLELAGGRVIALNLLELLPRPKDYHEVAAIFDKLADLDPYTHEINQKVAVKQVAVKVTRETAAMIGTNKLGTLAAGHTFTPLGNTNGWLKTTYNGSDAYVQAADTAAVESLAPNAAHVDDLLLELQKLTNCREPFVRLDWLTSKIATTAAGGLYLDFIGLKGKTLDETLKTLGTSRKELGDLPAASRAAVFKSRVTGSPRSLIVFTTRSAGTAISTNLGFLTEDLAAGTIDPKKHPILNLLHGKFDGFELIFPRENGFPAGTLYNGQEQSVDVAPSSIATDSTDLSPQKEVRPMISCMRCHADVWLQPFGNNVRWQILNGHGLGDILGDTAETGKTVEEIQSELLSRYGGDLKLQLEFTRTLLGREVEWVSGLPAEEAFGALGEVFNEYAYGDYTPARALRFAGYELVGDHTPLAARAAFDHYVPPIPSVRVDPAMTALRLWSPDSLDAPALNVFDWERVASTTLYLAQQNRQASPQAAAPVDSVMKNDQPQPDKQPNAKAKP